MIDIDSELDTRLRSFYEHIEEQQPSRGFESFDSPRRSPRRRTLNLVAGVAGVAIVAAGVSVFATELAGRHAVKPPASATKPALPSSSQLSLGLPSISHTVIKVTHGRGSATLPTFTPEGIIFIQDACIGAAPFGVQTANHDIDNVAEQCDGGSIGGVSFPANAEFDGKPLTLQIVAKPSTEWEIVVADSGPLPPLPLLGPSTIPAGAHILVPATGATGTSGVQTFMPTGPYFVQYTCVGAATIDFSTSFTSQEGPFVKQPCADGAIGTQESTKPTLQEPMNLIVETPPHTYWEVQVYELPAAKS
jgi:hypothetical protein